MPERQQAFHTGPIRGRVWSFVVDFLRYSGDIDIYIYMYIYTHIYIYIYHVWRPNLRVENHARYAFQSSLRDGRNLDF